MRQAAMNLPALVVLAGSTAAFVPAYRNAPLCHSSTAVQGYLDDLSKELYAPRDEPDVEAQTREATKLDEKDVDRFGVGSWESFVDFDEFDGGDGQMGVAGDGKKGLDKEWKGEATMAKSKMMSAKNAWGTNTGYADQLRAQGVETSRAQQLENWHNQQEVLASRKQHRWMTDEFDSIKGDENWRDLSSFGVERNQEFDLDETFGAVTAGTKVEGTIELHSRIGQPSIHEFSLKNSFMGFSDFRASFTPETSPDWVVEPTEGSLSGRKDTDFVVKFRPQNPGISEGYLVIDTEEDKWTWKLVGNTA